MSNDSGSENVRDKLIMFPIPRKQRRTRAPAPIKFLKVVLLVGGDFNFVLQHASGPEHTNNVGLLRLPKANGEVRRVLPDVSIRAVDFVFLANAVGENFDLGSDGALVVVQSLEREPQPVVLVAPYVLEQDGWAVVLGDEQVGRAVVVVVSGDDRTRIFELNLVEAHIGSDVFPSIRPEIAEQLDFAFAVFRLADSSEVHPAVVVVVEGGDAVGARPVGFGKFDLLEGFAVIVAPQLNRWSLMRCGNVTERFKFPLAWVSKKRHARNVCSNCEVDGTIVVVISADSA